MADAKRARLSHDKKGRFRRSKEVERRINLAKISVEKSPSPDEALCIQSGSKISGRRVVELELLAEALDHGCKVCAKPLQLSNVTEETVSGLGSFLYITCCNPDCGEINVCQTNKTHRVAGTMRGRPIFDVNTKLAAGLLRDFVADNFFFTTTLPDIYLIIHYPRHATCRNRTNTCQCTVIFP